MKRMLTLWLLALSACGGVQRSQSTRHDGDYPAPLDPTFHVLSEDRAPLVFTRTGRADAQVRYVFRRDPSPTEGALYAVALERRFAYAVGQAGVALRRTAEAGWQIEATGTEASLRGLAVATWEASDYAFRPDEPRAVPVYAVGDGGVVLRRGVNGRWSAQPSPTEVDLYAVAATAEELLAVGDHGTVLWLHDRSWRLVPSHTQAALRSVAMSDQAAVIVGDAGVIVECRFPGDTLSCVPRPSPTAVDLRVVAERTVRWDHGNISGFTVHELEAFGADGTRLTRAAWYPIELSAGRRAPFAVVGYAAQHGSWDVAQPEDVAVGAGGQLALVDPYKAWVPSRAQPAAPEAATPLQARDPQEPGAFDVQTLPEPIDLHAVTFQGLDGFVVGDGGTILQLTVEGAHIPVAVLLE